MTKFSERDIGRIWSGRELEELSQRDLTILAFRRAIKNAAFFIPTAIFTGLIAGTLGLAGKIIGWLAIISFVAFALEPLAGFALSVVALVGIPVAVVAGKQPPGGFDVPWRLLQLLVALLDTALYIGLATWVYVRMMW